MEFDFTMGEIIFIYGNYKKKIKELYLIKNSPNCPIADETIDQDIQIYSSITDKMAKCYPKLANIDYYI